MFKKSLVLGLVIGLMITGIAWGAVGDNVVVNGNFEDQLNGLNGWSLYAEKPAILSTSIGRGGIGKCASLTNNESYYSHFIQTMSISPGTLIDLSCYAKGENVRLTVEENVLGTYINPYPTPQNYADWTKLTLQYRTLTGKFNIILQKQTGVGTVYFDDVTAIIVEDGVNYIAGQNAIIADLTKSTADKDIARYNVACSESTIGKYQSAINLLTAISIPTEKSQKALSFCNEKLGDTYLSSVDFLNAKSFYIKANAIAIFINDRLSIKRIGEKVEGINLAIKQTTP